MGLIKVKAKVKLITEEDLEWDDDSMGKIYKNPEFVWKYKIIDAENIYELTELTKTKTVLERRDGSLLLIQDSIDNLYKLWENNLPSDLDLGEEYEEDTTDSENMDN